MFKRVLVCVEPWLEVELLGSLRRLLGRAEHIHLQVLASQPSGRWALTPTDDDPASADARLAQLVVALRSAATHVTAELVWQHDPELTAAALRAAQLEAVVFGPVAEQLPHTWTRLTALARDWGVPVVWLGAGATADRARQILMPYETRAEDLRAAAPFLRDRASSEDVVTLLALAEDVGAVVEPSAIAELTGLTCTVRGQQLRTGLLDRSEGFSTYVQEHRIDLLLLLPEALAPLTGYVSSLFGWDDLNGTRPHVVVLCAAGGRAAHLDAPDVLLEDDGRGRLVAHRRGPLGTLSPCRDPLRVLARGQSLGQADVSDGPATIALPSPPPRLLGLSSAREGEDDLLRLEGHARVVELPERPLLLLDAGLSPAQVTAYRAAEGASALGFALVRTDPNAAVEAIRAGLDDDAKALPLLDAGALLDDGGLESLPAAARWVRLVRLGRRFRARGREVVAVVTAAALPSGLSPPPGLAVLGPTPPANLSALVTETPLGPPFEELTGALPVAGNLVEVELSNTVGRRRLFELIDGATRRVHLQAYIVEDDELTRQLEAALIRAASRQVDVRLLADSRMSQHGFLGLRNPLLERLQQVPGIEVRAHGEQTSLPGLTELKLRNHRKLCIADGELAIVSGRNLTRSYYTDFTEVVLTPSSAWDVVPWLDAAAQLRGPLVAQVEAAFLADWTAGGGAPFEVVTPAAAGPSQARLILHAGLQDTQGLDAYLSLIEGATERIVVVNNFPLTRELERALLSARRRGVEVQLLIGNVRPRYGGGRTPFPGLGGVVRELADQVVRGHLGALLEAGARVHELAVSRRYGWDEAIDPLLPHVHAKLLCIDDRVCTVGSANLDLTASYWESEAVLVVEDPAVAARVGAELARLLEKSPRLHLDDPVWSEGADRRAWLAKRWPDVLHP
jgi:phosphatidylserine/phosphatidylglycerophosphate/cardiolipin synthase-like enzyme